jgi:hypothetical protein
MANAIFTFTKKDVMEYGSKHSYAQMMFVGAGEDYVAARCLCFNNLVWSGFPLLSQSVEKTLKAIIFLETKQRTALKGADKHNPYALKQELSRTADYGLDKYDTALKQLYGHFQHRYFDNKNKSNAMTPQELGGFDELWMHLFEKIPFPIEVKYRLQFPAMLFDEKALRLIPSYRRWAVYENKAIAPKLNEMEVTYRAVELHLYH